MSIFFREGDKPNQTDLNQPYSNVAAFTVATENCARDWSTAKHFDTSGDKINDIYFYSLHAGASYSTTSATFTTVTNGGNPATITRNETVPSDTLFRFSWDVLVGELTLIDDKSPYSDNIYAFRLTVNLNSGAVKKRIATASYSYNGRSHTTQTGSLLPSPINWRSCAGTALLIIESGDTLDSVTLEASTGGGNTLVVDRFNMTIVEARQ